MGDIHARGDLDFLVLLIIERRGSLVAGDLRPALQRHVACVDTAAVICGIVCHGHVRDDADLRGFSIPAIMVDTAAQTAGRVAADGHVLKGRQQIPVWRIEAAAVLYRFIVRQRSLFDGGSGSASLCIDSAAVLGLVALDACAVGVEGTVCRQVHRAAVAGDLRVAQRGLFLQCQRPGGSIDQTAVHAGVVSLVAVEGDVLEGQLSAARKQRVSRIPAPEDGRSDAVRALPAKRRGELKPRAGGRRRGEGDVVGGRKDHPVRGRDLIVHQHLDRGPAVQVRPGIVHRAVQRREHVLAAIVDDLADDRLPHRVERRRRVVGP